MSSKKKTETSSNVVATEIEKYSRQIWLAGLGAYSKVSKDGSKLFDSLVKDGEKVQKVAKTEVDKQVEAVKESVESAKTRVSGVKGKALGKWNELEEAFDKRLNSAISRLGVPSRNEVKALQDQVETLTAQIEKLTGTTVAAAKPAAKKAVKAPAKPAAKAAAKAPAKTAAKPAAKAPAKPAAKKPAAAKPAAKAAADKPAVAKEAQAKPAVAPAAKPDAAPVTPEVAKPKPVTFI
ncbi:MAG TPA: phasin family protein [Pseudomonas sp.]|nr:phasin family protein [Pseudomonas sp.]